MRVQVNARHVAAAAQSCMESIEKRREEEHAKAHEREVERKMRKPMFPVSLWRRPLERHEARMLVAQDQEAQNFIECEASIWCGKQYERAKLLRDTARKYLSLCEAMSTAPMMYLDTEDMRAIGSWLSSENYTHE